MLDALHSLSTASLAALAASLRDGVLALHLSRHGLQAIAGQNAQQVQAELEGLLRGGMTAAQVVTVVEAIAETRARIPDPADLFSLVLSGPDLPGVPTSDTAAVMTSLIGEAQTEVELVGYAVHDGKRLFAPVAERMDAVPTLRVCLCLDVRRGYRETTLDDDIVRRFVAEFRNKHWPWARLPDLFYDPRALSDTAGERASLHAKCVIVDRAAALITSANFTEAAHHRNIEAGVLVRHRGTVERLANYFEGLRAVGALRKCPLLA